MSPHLTEDDLLTATGEHPHARECASCERQIAAMQTLKRTLRAAPVWQESEPELPRRAPRLPVLAAAERIEIEEERARPAVAALIDDPASALAILGRYEKDAGLLLAVLDAAHALLDVNPELAFGLTVEAERLAGAIDWSTYPDVVTADRRGRVYRERANALRHLGRHHDALAVIADAKREYERSVASAHAIAVADYIEATILREQGRLDAAASRVERAAAVFTDFGDTARLLHCRMLEAVIAASAGKLRDARTLLLQLLADAQDDLPVRAQIHNNIGQLSVELGDHGLAATHLLQALHLYREVGMRTEEIRTNWGIAKLRLRSGGAEEAVARFEEAEAAFIEVGMQLEAALVALDRIEALLALDAAASLAEECRAIHARLREAGLTANALAALAYLEESVARGSAPRPELTRVRSYLERLRTEPALLFLPAP